MLLYERETLKYVRREANEILEVTARLYGNVMKSAHGRVPAAHRRLTTEFNCNPTKQIA
jgi:hypothetical protein